MSSDRLDIIYKSAAAVLAVCTATAVIGGAVSSWHKIPDRVAKLEAQQTQVTILRVQMNWVTKTLAKHCGTQAPDLSQLEEGR